MDIDFHPGDASAEEVLTHAHVDQAVLAVVTVPDPSSALHIIKAIQRLAPDLAIAARCRYHRSLGAFKALGVHILVDEEDTVGVGLGQHIETYLCEDSGLAFACRISGQPVEEHIQ